MAQSDQTQHEAGLFLESPCQQIRRDLSPSSEDVSGLVAVTPVEPGNTLYKPMAIIDWIRANTAIAHAARGNMDNNALQRAATTIMQESLREGFALTQRFLITREIRDYMSTFVTPDNREDVIHL